mmetsp:Transcript_17480/g.33136  ORF Transcript_17480/g.33136 Transcript_17480/m.33136 type:complete len:440 (+) Transcript_17480:109-1428(+)|eukprot:CAMPEP_0176490484 /NCGR_PEP_ID=MMETSP0200_2-20121128/7894_1 /TAXON_ID=947934 /ORGANISM="Chaetoceros sp., Strain GSL56" /LENGTH=439 /DNA_ID=CAMNT_0017887791 /DNA_START=92 /DNA_END=1411 /DNA_ORIENTATION=-
MIETLRTFFQHKNGVHHDDYDPNQVWKRIQNEQLFLPVPHAGSANNYAADADDQQEHQQQHTTQSASNSAPSPLPGVATSNRREEGTTRIACMSDTHGTHRKIFIPQCDILIHAGDLTRFGECDIVKDLAEYFHELVQEKRVGKVICIAGNHDLIFEPETFANIKYWMRFNDNRSKQNSNVDSTSAGKQDVKENEQDDILNSDTIQHFQRSCIYLQDESHIHNHHIEFYGSPWTPVYGHGWAFTKERQNIHEKWDGIPQSVDVLITHGPPLGRGDKVLWGGSRAGCANLLQQIQTRIHPRLCVFGHIHEDASVTFDGKTLYVNAANVSIRYRPQRPCVVIDLPHNPNESARVVVPKCHLTGEEVISWLQNHGYHDILPFFERCDPLLSGDDLVVGSQQPDFEKLAQKLKMNQQISFASMKKCKDELVTAMLHLHSMSYD